MSTDKPPLVDLEKYKAPKPRWIGYVMACHDGAYYVGITSYQDACWAAHMRGQHPFTRLHKPLEVTELKEDCSTKDALLLWQRHTILRLKQVKQTVVGGSHGAFIAKNQPWQAKQKSKVRKSRKFIVPSVPC